MYLYRHLHQSIGGLSYSLEYASSYRFQYWFQRLAHHLANSIEDWSCYQQADGGQEANLLAVNDKDLHQNKAEPYHAKDSEKYQDGFRKYQTLELAGDAE